MKFSVFQVSRKGGRQKNEDRMGYCYTRSSAIFLLADGMGGHPQGEVAAQLAIQTISSLFQREAQPVVEDVAAFLDSAALTAHRQILRYAVEKGMSDMPRTTVVVALVQEGTVTWMHCGDSRLYHVRQDELMSRTRDHSYREQQHMAPPMLKMSNSVNRNVLFTCLGSPASPVIEIAGPFVLQQGDKVMLCSDGLWDGLSEDDIVYHLGHKAVGESVPDLVEKALRVGGATSDNVTAIAFEWETPDDAALTDDRVSTDSISNGVFASTVQLGYPDSDMDDLDDAAIERSISEINEAIRRSAAKRG
ncbi:PP2C family serine/threonine-protein phosphatase [Rhodoferax sp. PAMC 29310]|uniref:PP2C family protein-serine/threonine phosphatase n=1 Tax=Rhodoferax sp. PAMC 29310 TaxID=2822760 RepID=UPI001B322CEE|nr:protein phosphatase 2C domain-containing protein [Rhodoferax sp. PAMC 29310]